ncbi:hypothetical protein ACLIJZ_00650 [Proteus mirabilis]|uniref:tail fiber/spike domain-containing protein n=1 Tax=Proteus mirabilis TaxID=584 RepID=UPI003A8E9655
MSTIPTQNPVPSEAPRDLKYNSGKVDEFVTSMKNKYIDRFGQEHFTIEGLRWVAQQAISQFGYITLDSFQKGAEITLPNQVLRDEVTGEYYRWDGGLPKIVPVSSTPSSSGGVGVGRWLSVGDSTLRSDLSKKTGLSIIGDKSGKNAQEVIDNLSERYFTGLPNPPQINIPSIVASSPSDDINTLIFGGNNSKLEYIEFIFPVTNKINPVDVFIYGDLSYDINTNNNNGTHVVYGDCLNLNRDSFNEIKGATKEVISDESLKISLDISSATNGFIAFSIRQSATESPKQVIKKIVIKQNGKTLARDKFSLTGSSNYWIPSGAEAKNITFNNEFSQRINIDKTTSKLNSSGVIKLSPEGSDSFKNDIFSLSFYYNKIRTLSGSVIREIQLKSGEYNGYRINNAFLINRETKILSIGGKSKINLGKYIPTSEWVKLQEDQIPVFSAIYDWDTNPDELIRNGSKQPFVGIEVPSGKTQSMMKYSLSQVQSKNDVLSTSFSYWYDHANKTLYFSFGEDKELAYLFVAESDCGVRFTDSVICSISGIDFYGCKSDIVSASSVTYKPHSQGGGLLSMHNCSLHGSYAGNGVATSNIDSELINVKTFSVKNDGFNAHEAGIMNIINGGAYNSGDDGASPHEDCVMYMQDADFHYSFAGNVTVAFGAVGFGYRLSSIAADNLSSKQYSGTLACLSGQGRNARASFDECYTNTKGRARSEYYAQSNEQGKIATLNISRRRRESSAYESVKWSGDVSINIS